MHASYFGYVHRVIYCSCVVCIDLSFILQVYAVVLAILNICLAFTISGKSLSDHICTHLNHLYMADLFIQLINLSAYYQVHDVLEISHRYQHEMLYGIVTLLLLVIVSNESRYAPSEPIIADTVSFPVVKCSKN